MEHARSCTTSVPIAARHHLLCQLLAHPPDHGTLPVELDDGSQHHDLTGLRHHVSLLIKLQVVMEDVSEAGAYEPFGEVWLLLVEHEDDVGVARMEGVYHDRVVDRHLASVYPDVIERTGEVGWERDGERETFVAIGEDGFKVGQPGVETDFARFDALVRVLHLYGPFVFIRGDPCDHLSREDRL